MDKQIRPVSSDDLSAGKLKQHAKTAKTLRAKLTDDEIFKAEKRLQEIVSAFQERYAVAQEAADK
jgi:uncharacterized protein YjbJ (UPF0337 family)